MMNFAMFVSSSIDILTIFLLVLMTFVSIIARREIYKVYIDKHPNEYYTKDHNRYWRLINTLLIIFVLITGSCKFVVVSKFMGVAATKTCDGKEQVVVQQTKPKVLDKAVFQGCLDSAKITEEKGGEVVRECREAATMDILE